MAVILFAVAGMFAFLDGDRVPRDIRNFKSIGIAAFGVIILIENLVPPLVVWALAFLGIVGLLADDFYEVMAGSKHWMNLVPLPCLFVFSIFAKAK